MSTLADGMALQGAGMQRLGTVNLSHNVSNRPILGSHISVAVPWIRQVDLIRLPWHALKRRPRHSRIIRALAYVAFHPWTPSPWVVGLSIDQ